MAAPSPAPGTPPVLGLPFSKPQAELLRYLSGPKREPELSEYRTGKSPQFIDGWRDVDRAARSVRAQTIQALVGRGLMLIKRPPGGPRYGKLTDGGHKAVALLDAGPRT